MTKDELKAARAKLGVTQQGLAVLTGYHVSTVSAWEQGVHKVPPAVARLIRTMLAEAA